MVGVNEFHLLHETPRPILGGVPPRHSCSIPFGPHLYAMIECLETLDLKVGWRVLFSCRDPHTQNLGLAFLRKTAGARTNVIDLCLVVLFEGDFNYILGRGYLTDKMPCMIEDY